MSRDRDALLGRQYVVARTGARWLVLALDTNDRRIRLLVDGIALWLDGAEFRRLVADGQIEERAA